MATYTSIPEVPEGTRDPAAGLNQALYVLGIITNCRVVDMTTTSPPALTGGGDKYIVAAAATGAWSGMDGYVAVDKGTHWDFFDPALVGQVIDLSMGCGHYHAGSDGWLPIESCAS